VKLEARDIRRTFLSFIGPYVLGLSRQRAFGLTPWAMIRVLAARESSSQRAEAPSFDADAAVGRFAPHYAKHIRPHVLELERRRTIALGTCKRRLRVFVPVVGVAVLILIWAWVSPPAELLRNRQSLEVVTFVVAAAAVGVWLWISLAAADYVGEYKSKIFPKIFAYFGEDYEFDPDGEIPVNLLAPSLIVPGCDYVDMEDHVKGTYKGVTLEIVEASLAKRRGHGKHSRVKEVFRGIFILLSVHKEFAGTTIVVSDQGVLGNLLSGRFKRRSLENVKLEDPVFEKLFEVYSTDQIEARYLLTVTFMERLLELAAVYTGKVQCSFYQHGLLIRIETKKSYFETGPIYQSVEENIVRDIRTVVAEMALIFQIVDTLKLDLDVGL